MRPHCSGRDRYGVTLPDRAPQGQKRLRQIQRQMLEVKEWKVNAAFCFADFSLVGYQDGTVKPVDLEWLPGSSDLTAGVARR